MCRRSKSPFDLAETPNLQGRRVTSSQAPRRGSDHVGFLATSASVQGFGIRLALFRVAQQRTPVFNCFIALSGIMAAGIGATLASMAAILGFLLRALSLVIYH